MTPIVGSMDKFVGSVYVKGHEDDSRCVFAADDNDQLTFSNTIEFTECGGADNVTDVSVYFYLLICDANSTRSSNLVRIISISIMVGLINQVFMVSQAPHITHHSPTSAHIHTRCLTSACAGAHFPSKVGRADISSLSALGKYISINGTAVTRTRHAWISSLVLRLLDQNSKSIIRH